ncbi:hypothetical protein ACHAO1_003305 [Botrytis cinerea]
MFSSFKFLLVCLVTLRTTAAHPATDEHNYYKNNRGTFQNPAKDVRPKFRYWLPDASVDPAGIAADIKEIGSIGAGGIEMCNYFMYGGQIGEPASDWSTYGFGTPAYNKILNTAAQATKDNDLVIDLALGPESGQGVPAEWDNPWQISHNIKVSAGDTYKGKVPGYGNGTLLSVTTAAILHSENYSTPNLVVGLIPNGFINWTVWNISADSLNDVTSRVRPDGTISLEFPQHQTAKEYFLWASYFKLSSDRAAIPGSSPQNFLQNGSFAVDHFSTRGAKVTTDFLEKYVLINGVKELFQQVGKYSTFNKSILNQLYPDLNMLVWEDSVEIKSSLYWTPDLAITFKEMHGYDIGKYAMLLATDNGLGFSTEYPDRVYTDALDRGQGYLFDYRATMTTLLSLYYEHLVNWSRRYLGLEFSAQTGYNLPVDMLEVIPVVSTPEDESLGFASSIDNYRQFVGPANLAGKNVISNEMGAISRSAYQQQLPDLLTLVKQAYSAGNNQMVIHGATYSYQYPNTTWPGFTPFGYLFSDQHSRHQPGWTNGYSDVLNYISRNNYILQSGVPKRDVVFWSKKSREGEFITPVYNYNDLVNTGYGYEYLSPGNFKLPQAIVRDGVLAPDGPAYKLLIVRSTEFLTTDGVDNLAKYAAQGLPIIISGGIPNQIASSKGLSDAQQKLKSLASLSNVHLVAGGPLASVISSLGIQPLTKVTVDQPWYTYWREVNKGQEVYVYIYNDGNSTSTGKVEFATTNVPYFFDAWKGDQRPVTEYNLGNHSTTIALTLAAHQSIIVGFLRAEDRLKRPLYVKSGPSPSLEYVYDESDNLIAKVPFSSSDLVIENSNGKKFNVSSKGVAKPFALCDWTLVAEKWGPPSNFDNASATSSKFNTTYKLPSLLSWPLIPGLQNTSGVGYYSNEFTWSDTRVGAFIDFGRVVHTLRVSVNGIQLPPLDVTHAQADISSYLVKGKNTINATISTTLINGLRPYLERLKTSGTGPEISSLTFARTEVEAGLVGEVLITPYELRRCV